MARAFLHLLSWIPGAALCVAACGGSVVESGASAGSGGVGGAGGSSGGTSGGAGGGADISACDSNTDCQLEPVGCCSCGSGPITNYTAINAKFAADYEQRCAGLACGACPNPENPDDPAHYYIATCQTLNAGQAPLIRRCQAIDLRTTEITQCTTASDCTLRSGTACCQGCGSNPVAINVSQEPQLEELVCSTSPTACSHCLPLFPDLSPQCTGGRCGVLSAPCTLAHPCPQ